MKSLLVYGGSFDPPHNGHVNALANAMDTIRPDLTMVVPCAIPPHKDVRGDTANGDCRMRLCEMAFSSLAGVLVSDRELKRGGVSYTSDTLLELSEEYPEHRIYLLMGTDMFLSLLTWHRTDLILSLSTPAVMPRYDRPDADIREMDEKIRKDFGIASLLLPYTPCPLSSTEVREQLPKRCGQDALPAGVYAEIQRLRLYTARPNLDWLREQSYAYHKPGRLRHVAGVEKMAIELAARWGSDEQLAAEAAILHDITKKKSEAEQLRLCEKYGIIRDDVEERNPALLHALTGARFSRELFGIDDEVFNAILYHTTGRPGMSLMEKILYLADSSEENRDYPGVEEIRSAAFEDLDRAMILSLQRTLNYVDSQENAVHPRSRLALEWFIHQKETTNET